MKKIKSYLFCISVIFTVVLLSTAQSATAVTINIITSSGKEQVFTEIGKYAKKMVEVEGDKVKVNITNAENYTLDTAFLYLCKDRNPIDCIKSNPIEFSNKVDTILKLSEIATNGKAGLLSIVKTNQSWLSDWDFIENGVLQQPTQPEIDVYSSFNINDTKNFIEALGMLPLGFIDRIDFKGKQVYQTTGEVSRRGFTGSENITLKNPKSGFELQREDGYIFALPFDQKIYSPLTFYNVPQVCGNAKCDIGENYQNCWLDCQCPTGQVPSRKGCVPSSSVRLIIDEIDPKPVDCLVSGLQIDPKGNTSCQPLVFDVDYHLENAPVNFSVFPASQFFEITTTPGQNATPYIPFCLPKNFAQLGLTPSDLGGRAVYKNVSEFECSIAAPNIYGIKSETDARSMLMGLYMNVLTQNGTELLEVSNVTTIPLDVAGLDLSELEDLRTKLEKNKHKMDVLNDIFLTLGWISFVINALWVGGLVCSAIALPFVWTGIGAKVAKSCYNFAKSWFPKGIVLGLLFYLIGVTINICAGLPVTAPIANIPAAPKYLSSDTAKKIGIDIEYEGAAAEIVSSSASKKASKDITAILFGGVSGGAIAALVTKILDGGETAIALAALLGTAGGAIGAANWCGKTAKLEDKLKQKIEHAGEQKTQQLQSLVTNLVWVNGNKTGKTSTVCGEENVRGFYNFHNLNCTSLWFSFNGKNRPTCNFNTGSWTSGNDTIFGDSCNPENTNNYQWIIQNSSGENLGVRNYNTTEIHKLFEKPAASMFKPATSGSLLNIFVSCDSQTLGEKIEDGFKLVNYSEACS